MIYKDFTFFQALSFLVEDDEYFDFTAFSKWLKKFHPEAIVILRNDCIIDKTHKDYNKPVIESNNKNINDLF